MIVFYFTSNQILTYLLGFSYYLLTINTEKANNPKIAYTMKPNVPVSSQPPSVSPIFFL